MVALKGQGVLGIADGSDESGAPSFPWGDVRTVSASRPGRCHWNGKTHHRFVIRT